MVNDFKVVLIVISLYVIYLLYALECHKDGLYIRPFNHVSVPRWKIGSYGTKMPLFSAESGKYTRPLPYAAVPKSFDESSRHLRDVELTTTFY